MAEHQQINVWVQGLSVHQMLIQQLCLLPAMSCRVEDRIYCKCKRINVKRKFFIFVSINIYVCMHGGSGIAQIYLSSPLGTPCVLVKKSHANWYISHCENVFQRKAYTNSSTKLPTLVVVVVSFICSFIIFHGEHCNTHHLPTLLCSQNFPELSCTENYEVVMVNG